MKKILALAMATFFAANSAYANLNYEGGFNPNLDFQQYVEAAYPKPQKSIIYIFTNNNPCYEECQKTLSLIRQVYDDNYANVYDFQEINYETDKEYNYVQAYNLYRPLEVVLVRAADGETLGYKKLDNLENQISDPYSFSQTLEYQIDNYLGQ